MRIVLAKSLNRAHGRCRAIVAMGAEVHERMAKQIGEGAADD